MNTTLQQIEKINERVNELDLIILEGPAFMADPFIKERARLERELEFLNEAMNMPMFEIDACLHSIHAKIEKLANKYEKDGVYIYLQGVQKHQERHAVYARIWRERFQEGWLQKVSWTGEAIKALTDWYEANAAVMIEAEVSA